MNNKFQNAIKKANELNLKPEIHEILTPEFLSKNTKYKNFEEMISEAMGKYLRKNLGFK